MRILTAEQMRTVDRMAIEEIGIPSMVLMENAALGVVEAIAEPLAATRRAEVRRVAIFCGPGNNGGDGLAIARQLDGRGYSCAVFLVLRGAEPRGDAGLQLAILERLGLEIVRLGPETDLAPAIAAAAAADLIVDALFGTGLERPLEGHYAALVEALDALAVPRLAVDLPSGLDASRAAPIGPHLRADLTVTFAAPKIAHVFAPASAAVGELVIADLGFSSALVEAAPGDLHLLVAEELAAVLFARRAESHKGDHGHALIVAGSPGKSGAAILAARAAVRAGAGLVTAAVPAPLLEVVDGGSLESMTLGLAATAEGTLARAAVAQVLEAAEGKQAVALGPGLGPGSETAAAIRELVLALPLPLVLDADGLNAFSGRAGELRGRPAPTVLTPHPGEMARLLGTTSAEVQADRLGAARRGAELTGAVVVLKGSQSLIAEPGGALAVNPTGNPGMASGGTGDVLSGVLAGLLAQGYEPVIAARLGVFLHGLAGDLAAETTGFEALAASDLITSLGAAFARLRG